MLKRLNYIFRLEWKYARVAFIWNVIEELIGTLSAVAVPFVMKYIVDAVMTGDSSNIGRIVWLTTAILAIHLAETVVYMATVYYRQDYIFTRDVKLKNDLYKMALTISPECFEKPETYDIYSRATEISLDKIHGAFYTLICSVFKIVTIISVAAIMVRYNPLISIIYLLAYIPLLWVKLLFQKKLNQFNVDNTVQERKKDAIFDFIHDKKAVAELKIFGAFPFIIRRRNEITRQMDTRYLDLTARNEMKQEAAGQIPEILYYAAYAVYAVFAIAGTITYGDLTFLITAMGTYRTSIDEMGIWFANQQDNYYMMDKMIAFFELPKERSDKPERDEEFHELSLENVSFTYPGSEEPVLHGLNMKIKQGEKVAIVGCNGSGKTTTVRLLLGLFDSFSGEYRLNGQNVKEMNHRDIYKRFSVGMQDYQKYPFSVRENIEISDYRKKDEQQFEKAVSLSGVDAIAAGLSGGYDTNLNKQYDPDGTELSEGQWHKLILARTLYQSHDFVIFDEPTSSLDPVSEYEFVQSMRRCMDDKTVVMITHRLSSVVDFMRIIVFDNGRIIGDGNHAELMKACPVYREMFETQAARYDA